MKLIIAIAIVSGIFACAHTKNPIMDKPITIAFNVPGTAPVHFFDCLVLNDPGGIESAER